MGFIKIKHYLLFLILYSSSMAFNWNDPESTQCIDAKKQYFFSESTIAIELDRAKINKDESKNNIFFSNAIEYARHNSRDLFCLSLFFKSQNQPRYYEKTSESLYELFILEGGLHSKKLNTIFSSGQYKNLFLYNNSELKMAKYNFNALLSLVHKSSSTLSFFFYALAIILFLTLLINYGTKITLWSSWRFYKTPTGALSLSILFLVFNSLALLDLRIAFILLLFFIRPLFFKKQKNIALFSMLFLCIGNVFLQASLIENKDVKQDSPSQISQSIWNPKAIDPSLPIGPLSKSILDYKKLNFSESLIELEKIEYLKPDNYYAYAVESAIQFKLENYESALNLQKKAFQYGLSPEVYFYNLNQIYSLQRQSHSTVSQYDSEANSIAQLNNNFISTLRPNLKKKVSEELLLPTPSIRDYLREIFNSQLIKNALFTNIFILIFSLSILFLSWPKLIKSNIQILYRSELRNHFMHYRTRKLNALNTLRILHSIKKKQSPLLLISKSALIAFLITFSIPTSFIDYKINLISLILLLILIYTATKKKESLLL